MPDPAASLRAVAEARYTGNWFLDAQVIQVAERDAFRHEWERVAARRYENAEHFRYLRGSYA